MSFPKELRTFVRDKRNATAVILHIDCNTFFASCEVAQHPEVAGKPVVVANGNEAGGGIILALTKEAKALGLKRGNPLFKVKDVLAKNKVAIFPANHALYSEISHQLMLAVQEQGIVLNFVQYSVDEFFGELPTDNLGELRRLATMVKERIESSTHIPVSCGLSLSYTLAKVATWYAKRYDGYHGICILPEEKIETALKTLPIADVWGIGRRSAPRLESDGIHTAWDFASLPDYAVQRTLHTPGLRTWKELHGTPCIDIEPLSQQKSIMHSRTFAYMTDDKSKLQTCISNYAVATARKLREQHSVCLAVTVFLNTNPHRDDLKQYGGSSTVRFSVATSDNGTIVKAAREALDKVFRAGYQYKRAGVILSDITPDEAIQLDMFGDASEHMERSRKLMAAVDAVNAKFGVNSVRLAAQGFDDKAPDARNPLLAQEENGDIGSIKKTR